MLQFRFSLLLATLILMLLSVPFLTSLGTFARIAFTTLFFSMILSAVYAVSDRRSHLLLMGGVAMLAILMRIITLYMAQDHSWWLKVRISGMVVEKFCLVCVVILILKFVLTSKRVTFNVICASLCAYLLLGILWAQAYMLTTAIDSGAFGPPLVDAAPLAAGESRSLLGRVDDAYVTSVYLSFVTLTTLGYGDITPRSESARMLVVVEAIVGQFYLTVLVARLVGLHIAGSGEDPSGNE